MGKVRTIMFMLIVIISIIATIAIAVSIAIPLGLFEIHNVVVAIFAIIFVMVPLVLLKKLAKKWNIDFLKQ